MNWDSFVPDLIVGIATGGLVGLVVLGAERRISGRARRREVEDAQSNAVERARALLPHKVRSKTDVEVLHLDMAQFDRLREVIRSVPSGEPRELVPGYSWAAEASRLADDIEALADALDGRISDYTRDTPSDMNTAKWMRKTISELASNQGSTHSAWEWQWNRDVHPRYALMIGNDTELTAMVNRYLWKCDLLIAHREAFQEADEIWRTRSWEVTRPDPVGYKPSLIQALLRPWKRRRALARARWDADQAAGAIVIAAHAAA
ncbi:hypothetical protein E0W80_04410 [Microbacterium sp. PI-1]|uniref:hypothetical protein n=1 Tax=Microbacterium sp. PI-1 TaxID=2545631 RepID=UPI00103CA0EE|nr:hypothetical protein [Microbacterium sp. PI-1]TCJ28748.1 hypothetical protein E0W80_04410 [Microbacterium sp. PI-1]